MATDNARASSYLHYLPAIFTGDHFLGRFLLGFEEILTGQYLFSVDLDFVGELAITGQVSARLRQEFQIHKEPLDAEAQIKVEQAGSRWSIGGTDREYLIQREKQTINVYTKSIEAQIAALASLFDPWTTQEAFLPWLASWVSLVLRADWKIEQQRALLAKIVPLYRHRGTKANLMELLKIYTGRDERWLQIVEGEATAFQVGHHATVGVNTQIAGSFPHNFRVIVNLEPKRELIERQHQIVTALIKLEKPAQSTYTLELRYATLQIGLRSTIGQDMLLGWLPPASTTLQIGVQSRIGVDTFFFADLLEERR